MIGKAFDLVLRLPSFRGRARLQAGIQRLLEPTPSRIVNDLKMELDPQEWAQVDLRANRCLEPRTTRLFERILQPGDTCVDVGAHVGYHTLCARRAVGERGLVVAVEPQPCNCDRLMRNAQLNGFSNIVVIAAAAGAASGFVHLRGQSRRDRTRLTLHGAGVNDEAISFVVPLITLDFVFETCGIERLALLKIDVEGYEPEVLQGARDRLPHTDNIVFEVLPDADEIRVRELVRLLRDCGFALCDVGGEPWRAGRPAIENNVWARRE